MYTVNHRQRHHKLFLRFLLFAIPFVAILVIAIWFIFFRDTNSTSANFTKAGAEVAVVKPDTKDFTNEYFKITLPSSWVADGRKNPHSYEVYYEFHNTLENYDNRWLRVYVDVIPDFQKLNRLLPVSIVNNRLVPGSLSDDCRSFTGAPTQNSSQSSGQSWKAKWQGVEFFCDMNISENYMGTASVDQGYSVSLANGDGSIHKYFIVYIDHNIHPDYQLLSDVVKSFETL